MAFAHALGDDVQLKESTGEDGKVIARMESQEANDAYLVRYVDAEGRQVEAWLADNAIEARPA